MKELNTSGLVSCRTHVHKDGESRRCRGYVIQKLKKNIFMSLLYKLDIICSCCVFLTVVVVRYMCSGRSQSNADSSHCGRCGLRSRDYDVRGWRHGWCPADLQSSVGRCLLSNALSVSCHSTATRHPAHWSRLRRLRVRNAQYSTASSRAALRVS